MEKNIWGKGGGCFIFALVAALFFPFSVKAIDSEKNIGKLYREYQERFALIETVEDIEPAGYRLLEKQIFTVEFETFDGEIRVVPAMETACHRLALFFADREGNVVFKTNDLYTNQIYKGTLKQPNVSLIAYKAQDLNHDNKKDLIIISKCRNEEGKYAYRDYKAGDVLFQSEGGFYRDWRISDKINRFGMNRNLGCISAFVGDGNSVEYLYTASTLKELTDNGFQVVKEQCYWRKFEKLGRLQVVPGTTYLSGNQIFMVYLVNGQGQIVWSFQPMSDYDSLYALKGMTGRDVDGDGMMDLVILAKYSYEPEGNKEIQKVCCSIYYQRTDGFVEDTEFEKYYRCTDSDTLEELIPKIREFWGWKAQ